MLKQRKMVREGCGLFDTYNSFMHVYSWTKPENWRFAQFSNCFLNSTPGTISLRCAFLRRGVRVLHRQLIQQVFREASVFLPRYLCGGRMATVCSRAWRNWWHSRQLNCEYIAIFSCPVQQKSPWPILFETPISTCNLPHNYMDSFQYIPASCKVRSHSPLNLLFSCRIPWRLWMRTWMLCCGCKLLAVSM